MRIPFFWSPPSPHLSLSGIPVSQVNQGNLTAFPGIFVILKRLPYKVSGKHEPSCPVCLLLSVFVYGVSL